MTEPPGNPGAHSSLLHQSVGLALGAWQGAPARSQAGHSSTSRALAWPLAVTSLQERLARQTPKEGIWPQAALGWAENQPDTPKKWIYCRSYRLLFSWRSKAANCENKVYNLMIPNRGGQGVVVPIYLFFLGENCTRSSISPRSCHKCPIILSFFLGKKNRTNTQGISRGLPERKGATWGS